MNPAELPPSIIAHVSVGTNQFDEALAFYDRVLATLGIGRVFEEQAVKAVAYGRQFHEFWLQQPYDGQAAVVGNGYHVAFLATSTDEVDAFHRAALQAGAVCDGEPGPRPHYSDAYYGCFVRDLDGHKIEATFWDARKLAS